MIVHMWRARFKDGTSPADITAARSALSRLVATEPVTFSTVGRDIVDEGYHLSYCAAFPDLAALQRYLHEPAQREADLLILPLLARIASVDITDDPDTDLAAKVGAMFQQRIDADAELAQLFASVAGTFAA
ncbi:MAG TPA: Dabb family protein [Pseudonocardia sp.]